MFPAVYAGKKNREAEALAGQNDMERGEPRQSLVPDSRHLK